MFSEINPFVTHLQNRNGELGIENDGSNVKDATRVIVSNEPNNKVKIDAAECG